ncbi:hypothetical protein [Spirosoma aerolatum]|uniref:hypothetical protein n=1 Tax=Spirosoma aerolatum TaxID=1211326 RepID=UPI0009AE4785|nr:hypothetical protein [Spirosoma aerolatum]
MKCRLIVNRNGLLSACPTEADFEAGNFHTDPTRFVVEPVSVVPETFRHLWANRDNAFILHPDLPARTEHPERVWYQIKDGYLVKVKNKKTTV